MHRIVFWEKKICLAQNLFSRAHDIISIVNCQVLRRLLLEATLTDLHLVMSAAFWCSASIVRPLVLGSLRTVAHPGLLWPDYVSFSLGYQAKINPVQIVLRGHMKDMTRTSPVFFGWFLIFLKSLFCFSSSSFEITTLTRRSGGYVWGRWFRRTQVCFLMLQMS